MIIEHFLYNISIAIVVGILYNHYYHRNPTWIIIVASLLPDIDYFLQKICYLYSDICGYISPIMITHGNFHNIIAIIGLSVFFAILIKIICNERFVDAVACLMVGCTAHLVEDICVYNHIYFILVPISDISFRSLDIMHESRDMMFGMGDWNIFIIGICLIIYLIIVKCAIEGTEWISKIIDFKFTFKK